MPVRFDSYAFRFASKKDTRTVPPCQAVFLPDDAFANWSNSGRKLGTARTVCCWANAPNSAGIGGDVRCALRSDSRPRGPLLEYARTEAVVGPRVSRLA